jgi:hypothetical protein
MKLENVTVEVTCNTDAATQALTESIDVVSAKLLTLENDLFCALTAFRNCHAELRAIKSTVVKDGVYRTDDITTFGDTQSRSIRTPREEAV